MLACPKPPDGNTFSRNFSGESTPDGEAIRFAVTTGDEPLAGWAELGGGEPLLTSSLGERGLRDPHIVRHPHLDRWYLLATDLRIQGTLDVPGGGFARAQQTGSRSLMVWESDDLVTWSPQRMVEVAPPEAGNVWAPEAVWDPDRGEFFVFWASALYPRALPTADRRIVDSYQRMFFSTTRDFATFTPPQIWIDERRGPGLGFIDSTLVADDDGDGRRWYRFTKDEAHMLPRLETSRDLHATRWDLVAERIGAGQPNPWGGTFTAGEGPTVVRAPDGTGWYLFIDQPEYHGGQGYLPFFASPEGLASGDFRAVAGELPRSPRHGTVVAITADERDRLVRALS